VPRCKTDSATGEGELVRFGEWVWYRFAFKIGADWPRDLPAGWRTPCRTVIHQVEQDSFKDGASCNASPFFKIEARPLGERVRFFAQVAAGAACATPPVVRRTQICVIHAALHERWATVHVRLFPAQDASGRADVWLDDAHCGCYRPRARWQRLRNAAERGTARPVSSERGTNREDQDGRLTAVGARHDAARDALPGGEGATGPDRAEHALAAWDFLVGPRRQRVAGDRGRGAPLTAPARSDNGFSWKTKHCRRTRR
jgi:hypothetical protein